MKKAWVLSRVYINSLYGISRFLSDIKKDKKSAMKALGFIVIILFAASGTATTFVAINLELYKVLAPAGQQGVIINSSILLATLFTMVFGFVGIIATYFIDREADIILSMPFKPWNVLFAKFSTSYIMEFLITLFVMGTGVIVYGVKSGEGALFYIMFLIVALLIPLIPLTLSYFVIIPMMKLGSIFRKKDASMIITSFLAMFFIIGFQGFFSKTMMNASQNPQLLAEMFTKKDGIISLMGRVYPPSAWGTYAITDIASSSGTIGLILLILTGIIAVTLLHLLMSSLYIQSIIGSGEVKKVTKKYSDTEFKGNLKGKSKLLSMVIREIKLMNREPVFFLNGPFIVILLPLIFGIMFTIQGVEIFALIDKVKNINNFNYYATLAIAGFGAMLGGMASITPSGISREGKAFMFLKSMPIDPRQYVNAKLIHALIFSLFGGVVACVIGSFIPGIGILNILIAFVIGQLVVFPILVLGMILELAWPKLIWDNAQKAIKQNMNVLIVVLGQMFLVYGLAFLVLTVLKNPAFGYTAFTVIPAVLGAALYSFLRKYSLKRFYEIEI